MLNLYESEKLSSVTGSALRPGGIDLTKLMLNLCELKSGSMVLDMGCGQGATLALLQELGHCPYGVDISGELLAKAMEAAPKAILAKASAEKTPLKDCFFDLVVSECVFSLMENPEAMLTEVRRILKPGGLLGLTDIYIRELGDDACDLENVNCCIKGAMQITELTPLIESQGFEVLHFSDHTEKLKQLTAELIFAYGSIQAFWGLFINQDKDEAENKNTCGLGHKYGYYMMIVKKTD